MLTVMTRFGSNAAGAPPADPMLVVTGTLHVADHTGTGTSRQKSTAKKKEKKGWGGENYGNPIPGVYLSKCHRKSCNPALLELPSLLLHDSRTTASARARREQRADPKKVGSRQQTAARRPPVQQSVAHDHDTAVRRLPLPAA